MPLRLAELGCEKSLDKIQGDGCSYGPATHTKNVHVIVFDTLPGRKMVVN
jgi:hypothetical protein